MIRLVRRYPLSTMWSAYVLYVFVIFRYIEAAR